MGSEDKGIQSSLLKICDSSIKLPMEKGVDSLNVSVACGIVLYEKIRQQLASK
jgi:23S rRNA (guanosine2251-2'-O)-methyltransferase